METITTINGNKHPITRELPVLEIIARHTINDVALAHIRENTGLEFTKTVWGHYTAQPTECSQIAALLLTYNFKTQYNDNGSIKNTILLKFCDPEGFKVDAICFDCVGRNHICTNGLEAGDILSV